MFDLLAFLKMPMRTGSIMSSDMTQFHYLSYQLHNLYMLFTLEELGMCDISPYLSSVNILSAVMCILYILQLLHVPGHVLDAF